MKALVILTFFFVMGVQAEEADKKFDNQHQLSRRPYQQAPAAKAEKFEGDVEAAEEASDKKYKLINLHQLGRRPYAEKNTD